MLCILTIIKFQDIYKKKIMEKNKIEKLDSFLKKDEKRKNVELIKEIKNEIEILDKEEYDLAEAERINKMSEEEWFILANSLN